jgi:biopolymer transport protein ExbD
VKNARPTPRQRRRRERPALGLNLTSMIDVTFLLLVYFMVATEFKLGEEVYRLDLPERGGAAAPRDPFELDDEPLRIEVATTGVGPADYRLRVDGPYPQPRSFLDLQEFLNARRISADLPGGLFTSEHPIVIEPTATTRWQHALEVFNAAVKAEYTNVTLGGAG